MGTMIGVDIGGTFADFVRLDDVFARSRVRDRVTVIQKKGGRPI